MALLMNDGVITYYHMEALRLMGLAQSYFSDPDYFVVQYCVHAVFLFPDLVTLYWLNVFHFVKILPGIVGHMYACMREHIVANIDVAYPFVITAFPSPTLLIIATLLIIS